MKLIKHLLGYCDCCNRWFVYPKRRRTNTTYVEEELNYITCCLDCHKEAEEYWKERWDDYYNSR